MDSKFINIPTALGAQTVSVDNIARVESWMGGGSKVYLKEVRNGSNVEILSSASQSDILRWISAANAS